MTLKKISLRRLYCRNE